MSSDQQVAFDNWQQAAEQLQKEQQVQNQETGNQQSETKQAVSNVLDQQKNKQKQVQLDPRQLLKAKVQQYQNMKIQEFQQCSDQITQTNMATGKKIGNPVLKSDKDFNNYAKILAKRFDNMVQNENATVDEEKLSLFFEEMAIYMYKNLEWKNLHEVQSKLKVLKKQRKTEQDKRKKQKQKQERTKKNLGEGSQSQSQSQHNQKQQKGEEDLFGGVSNITSKQEQQERKNKIITEQPKKQEKQEQQDDDDFM